MAQYDLRQQNMMCPLWQLVQILDFAHWLHLLSICAQLLLLAVAGQLLPLYTFVIATRGRENMWRYLIHMQLPLMTV